MILKSDINKLIESIDEKMMRLRETKTGLSQAWQSEPAEICGEHIRKIYSEFSQIREELSEVMLQRGEL